jgi:hypothetical protein
MFFRLLKFDEMVFLMSILTPSIFAHLLLIVFLKRMKDGHQFDIWVFLIISSSGCFWLSVGHPDVVVDALQVKRNDMVAMVRMN